MYGLQGGAHAYVGMLQLPELMLETLVGYEKEQTNARGSKDFKNKSSGFNGVDEEYQFTKNISVILWDLMMCGYYPPTESSGRGG